MLAQLDTSLTTTDFHPPPTPPTRHTLPDSNPIPITDMADGASLGYAQLIRGLSRSSLRPRPSSSSHPPSRPPSSSSLLPPSSSPQSPLRGESRAHTPGVAKAIAAYQNQRLSRASTRNIIRASSQAERLNKSAIPFSRPSSRAIRSHSVARRRALESRSREEAEAAAIPRIQSAASFYQADPKQYHSKVARSRYALALSSGNAIPRSPITGTTFPHPNVQTTDANANADADPDPDADANANADTENTPLKQHLSFHPSTTSSSPPSRNRGANERNLELSITTAQQKIKTAGNNKQALRKLMLQTGYNPILGLANDPIVAQADRDADAAAQARTIARWNLPRDRIDARRAREARTRGRKRFPSRQTTTDSIATLLSPERPTQDS